MMFLPRCVMTTSLAAWNPFVCRSAMVSLSSASFAATSARIGTHPAMYETPRFESIDIDDQNDWELAVVAGRYLAEKEGGLT